MTWEERAKIIYAEHDKLQKAIAAGRLIDNRLDQKVSGPYGHTSISSTFDMQQYLAYFDGQVLKQRGLIFKP